MAEVDCSPEAVAAEIQSLVAAGVEWGADPALERRNIAEIVSNYARNVSAERDTLASALAQAVKERDEARGENAWRPIESAPKGDEIFMAATADGRIMIFRGSILANMMKRSTPDHLQFPATHWRPPPSPPPAEGEGR
jgi:hypothetical protein